MTWYVAIAKNGRALRAVDELLHRQVLVLCPMEREYVRIKGRRYSREHPLLGRYLIVDADTDDDLATIRKTAEITGFLSDDRGPLKVAPRFVDALLEDEANGEHDRTAKTKAFTAGEKVRITQEGAFNDLVGEIRKAKGNQRWQIFLDACRIPVTMEEDEMERVEEKAA